MNIEVGGTYSAKDRQGKTIFVEVWGDAGDGKYLCKRIENGRELVLSKSNIKSRIGRDNGNPDQPKNSEGLREPIEAAGLSSGGESGSNERAASTEHPAVGGDHGGTRLEGSGSQEGSIQEEAEEKKVVTTFSESWIVKGNEGKFPTINSEKILENGAVCFLTSFKKSENELANNWSWWSDCGRFVIVYSKSKLSGGENHFSLWGRIEEGIHLIEGGLSSIRWAAKAAPAYLATKHGLEKPGKVNWAELVETFRDLRVQGGLDPYNEGYEKWLKEGGRQPYQVEPPEIEEDDSMVNIREKAAIGLGTKLGMDIADLSHLQASLNRVGDFISDDLESQLTKAEKKTIDSLRKANSEGKEIQIIGDAPAKPKAKPKAKAKPKPAKAENKPAKAKAKPKEAKEKKERGPSQLDVAFKVLKETKKESMTPKEIVARMIEKGYWSPGKGKTPESTLSAHVGADKRFKRLGRGQIALA